MSKTNNTANSMNMMEDSLARNASPQRKIQEDPMNTAHTTSYIRRISIVFVACLLVGAFWYTGFANSLKTPVSDKPAEPSYVVEALLNGDSNFAPDSIEYAIEKEFFLPHVVDLAAGSKFVPSEASTNNESSPDLANALSGKPTQCSMRGHGGLALNDAPGCM